MTAPLHEGLFAVDAQQRVIHWSEGAAALTGVPPEIALSLPCFDIVHGRDPFGRLVCQFDCPAMTAIRAGRLSAGSSVTVQRDSAPPLRLRCELSALPLAPGGAIGRLSLRQPSESRAGETGPEHDPARESTDIVRDLAALAALTTSLSGHDIQQGLERALDILCEATGTESAELFLVEPDGQDMLLTSYRGPFRSAFYEIVRFAPGEGFPGLVTSEHQPVATDELQQDARYLRARVKAKSFRSYLCVPLGMHEGIIGTVCLASRDSRVPLENAQRLLTWASVPMTTALQASLLQSGRLVTTDGVAAAVRSEADLDRLLHQVLHRTIALAQANGGVLELFGQTGGVPARRVAAGIEPDIHCPALICPDRENTCPALVGHHGIALFDARRTWPTACRRTRRSGALTYCLPLRAGDEAIGMIWMVYQNEIPTPPTRHLRALLECANQAAHLVKLARDQTAAERVGTGAIHQRLQSKHPTGPEATDHGSPATVARTDETEPFLRARCFGRFELHRQGEILTPRMFKRRKALALLKILLLHAGQPVPNETLIEWLWPESDPQTGANRLYVVVHALREMVDPTGTGNDQSVIRTSGDHYAFDPGVPCWLDLTEFRAAVLAGRQAEARGDRATALVAYDTAVRLYRGDLLEDEPFAEWCWLEREHLRETHLNALQRLAGLSNDGGDLARAIDVYRQALQVDPLREEIQRRLIECLWAAGRRDEALHQYEILRALLRRELDIAPLPETENLIRRIRGEPDGFPRSTHSADSV